ncbi:uncharacterized protein METZ01_LOCUS258105, partial [marine metagenome]
IKYDTAGSEKFKSKSGNRRCTFNYV